MRVPSARALLIAGGLLAFVPACWSAPRAPTKLAIVDVGTQARVPPVFVDFLTVVLSREPQVALLERQKVTRLLRDLCFPPEVSAKLVIRDIAFGPKGLFILTDDALYLAPDIREPSNAVTSEFR